MLQPTKRHRSRRRESLVVIDDTLCEHVGSLVDYGDRHDNHSDGTYPLAHNPVTSFYVSGPVRFPLGLRLSRRYAELTQWEAAVARHFPELKIPPERKARNRLHKLQRLLMFVHDPLAHGTTVEQVLRRYLPNSRAGSSYNPV
jgi:hypothetical protein